MKREYFKICYKILGLSDKKNITDEMVLDAYNSIMEQLSVLKERARTEGEVEYFEELEIAIKDSYRILQTEEKRKRYDDFLLEVEKRKSKDETNLKPTKTEPKMSLEEYEQRKRKIEESRIEMKKRLQKSIKEMPSKRISEDGIRYTPIYNGQMNSVPRNDRKDDDAR